jgi:hypothetical protein
VVALSQTDSKAAAASAATVPRAQPRDLVELCSSSSAEEATTAPKRMRLEMPEDDDAKNVPTVSTIKVVKKLSFTEQRIEAKPTPIKPQDESMDDLLNFTFRRKKPV